MEYPKTIKNDAIRREWDYKNVKWCYSVVDSVGITAKTSDPRNYWKVLKSRLKNSQNQLVTQCNQLKMLSSDGKFYLTDVADQETILEIIKVVSPAHLHVFAKYFSNFEEKTSENSDTKNHPVLEEKKENESYPQSLNKNTEFEENLVLKIDGYRENNFLIIKAFVAGVDPDKILISATADTVTISGHRPCTRQDLVQNLVEELFWGKFSRTIELPEEIEINQVEVTEYNGLLTIKLPVINKTRSRVLRIKTI